MGRHRQMAKSPGPGTDAGGPRLDVPVLPGDLQGALVGKMAVSDWHGFGFVGGTSNACPLHQSIGADSIGRPGRSTGSLDYDSLK